MANATAHRKGYMALMTQTNRPLASRRAMKIGRGGELRIPRKFHLSEKEIVDLAAAHEAGDTVPNPHNSGNYFFIIEALKALGTDAKHTIKSFTAKVRELMSDSSTKKTDKDGNTTTAWQRFRDKASRVEEETAAQDRIFTNVTVLQRTGMSSNTPYGLKLLQVGTKVLKTKGVVIDLLKDDDGEVMIRLNTDSSEPVNELKHKRSTEPKPEKKVKAKKKNIKAKEKKEKKDENSDAPKANKSRAKKAKVKTGTDVVEPVTVATSETSESSEPTGNIETTETAEV